MKNKNMKVTKFLEKFKLTSLNDGWDTETVITSPSIHRLGFELTGLYGFDSSTVEENHHIIAWGRKEERYLISLGTKAKEVVEKVFENISIPVVLLTKTVTSEITDLIVKVATKHKVAVVHTDMHLSTIRSTIGYSMVEYFAEATDVHASLVIINGHGVLIVGKSGVGKSESVLDLIQAGHTFVADDTVGVSRIGDHYFGRHSIYTKGFLEIRGLGIIDVERIYGKKLVAKFAPIAIVVELVEQDGKTKFDRIGNTKHIYEICGGDIPKIQIPVNKGRSTSSLILAAVNLHVAGRGENPMDIISERIMKEKATAKESDDQR